MRPPVAKGGSVFRCTDCGAEQPKWGGRCEACGAWNALVEEPVGRKVGRLEGWKAQANDATPVQLSNLPTVRPGRANRPARVRFRLGRGNRPRVGRARGRRAR